MADLKWKIRLARDMAQEALVVIEAPIAAQGRGHELDDVDPDVIEWSNDDVMGDREAIEICPADAKVTSPRRNCRQSESPKTSGPIGSPG
jgi:hypothetical protein